MLLVYRFISGLVCPLFLPAVFVLEKKNKAEPDYFSGISRNQAAPGRWLVVHKQTDWVSQEIHGIPSKGKPSEATGSDQNSCLDTKRYPSLALHLISTFTANLKQLGCV